MSNITETELLTLQERCRDLLPRFSDSGLADPKDVQELERFREDLLPVIDSATNLEPYQDPEALSLTIRPGHTLPSASARDYLSRARKCLEACLAELREDSPGA